MSEELKKKNIFRPENLTINKEFCICGARLKANEGTFMILSNRNMTPLNRNNVLCDKCALGLLEFLSTRHYINTRTALEEYADYFSDESIREHDRRSQILSDLSNVRDTIDFNEETLEAIRNQLLSGILENT